MANLTPPVAIPAYAAAAISGANPSKTGWSAFKIALPSFLIPYAFVYYPSLLFVDTKVPELALAFITCLLGVFMIGIGFEEYAFVRRIPKWKALMTLVGGILMIAPNLIADAIAFIILIFVVVTEVVEYQKSPSTQ